MNKIYSFCLFVLFDSLHPSQHFFSYVLTGLPGLNQYQARNDVSCSRTQRSDACEEIFIPEELEVRSFNHPYSLKTKSSQCHYVVTL